MLPEASMNMSSNDNRMPFGEMLREQRVEIGIGLSRFAGIMEMLPSALAAIEHGRAEPLSALRERFADNLALSPEERQHLLDAPCGLPDKRSLLFS